MSFKLPGLVYGVTCREYPASSLFYQQFDYRYWVSMKQIHSSTCVVVTPEMLSQDKHVLIENADAIITKEQGVLLSVRTADCLPILIAHESGVVGAVHAGRKGTESEIIIETLRSIKENFGELDGLKFWFGPAICEACYQIDRELDLHYDLVDENKKQIASVLKSGTYEITESGLCTVERTDMFYSYRKEGELAGRLQSYIGFLC
ncbi:MAG: laccase domain-containing protein [Candidatus Margulisbacteria bacterium]|nr:laccase domain-containing protein [Candidatus Margulisiibacteriota bacterium]